MNSLIVRGGAALPVPGRERCLPPAGIDALTYLSVASLSISIKPAAKSPDIPSLSSSPWLWQEDVYEPDAGTTKLNTVLEKRRNAEAPLVVDPDLTGGDGKSPTDSIRAQTAAFAEFRRQGCPAAPPNRITRTVAQTDGTSKNCRPGKKMLHLLPAANARNLPVTYFCNV